MCPPKPGIEYIAGSEPEQGQFSVVWWWSYEVCQSQGGPGIDGVRLPRKVQKLGGGGLNDKFAGTVAQQRVNTTVIG